MKGYRDTIYFNGMYLKQLLTQSSASVICSIRKLKGKNLYGNQFYDYFPVRDDIYIHRPRFF